MASDVSLPLLRKIDCIQIPVPDLDAALAFYVGGLGHVLSWRTNEAAGLRLPESDAEIVLQAGDTRLESNFLVESAAAAADAFVAAGGRLMVPPFEIQIGRCAVVNDPWGNRLVLLDLSKGLLAIDDQGWVIGNIAPADEGRTHEPAS